MKSKLLAIVLALESIFTIITVSVIQSNNSIINFGFSLLFFFFIPSFVLFLIILKKNFIISKKVYLILIGTFIWFFIINLFGISSSENDSTGFILPSILSIIPFLLCIFIYKSQIFINKNNSESIEGQINNIKDADVNKVKKSKILKDLDSYSQLKINELLDLPESEFLEFKSTLKWDIRQERSNSSLILEIIKTIAGFLNNKGGILIIGYDDDNNVVYGLEKDYPVTSKKNNFDGWQLHLVNHINEKLGRIVNHNLSIEPISYDGKTLAKIKVTPSSEPVFTKEDNKDGNFYVRIHGQTENLSPQDANSWINQHFKNNRN